MTGFKGKTVNRKTGKRPIVFNPSEGFSDLPVQIPCGQCIGCRLELSRQWAIRCMHEAQLKDENMFITLTYSNEHLPHDESLNKDHFPLFIKRYRRYLDRQGKGESIRYYHCGEYGDDFDRPHYHAIIFGHIFKDKKLWKKNLYTSKTLDGLWQKGAVIIGAVTFESAAYVARYCTKKVGGKLKDGHYLRVDKSTGSFHTIEPEYSTMSRRPGIGSAWFDQFKEEIYPDDFIIVRGRKMKPPKYYEQFLSQTMTEDISKSRRVKNRKQKWNNTPARLAVREQCAQAKLSMQQRTLEK